MDALSGMDLQYGLIVMESWVGPGNEAKFTLGEHKILLAANIFALLWTVVLHKFALQEIARIRYVTFGMET